MHYLIEKVLAGIAVMLFLASLLTLDSFPTEDLWKPLLVILVSVGYIIYKERKCEND